MAWPDFTEWLRFSYQVYTSICPNDLSVTCNFVSIIYYKKMKNGISCEHDRWVVLCPVVGCGIWLYFSTCWCVLGNTSFSVDKCGIFSDRRATHSRALFSRTAVLFCLPHLRGGTTPPILLFHFFFFLFFELFLRPFRFSLCQRIWIASICMLYLSYPVRRHVIQLSTLLTTLLVCT